METLRVDKDKGYFDLKPVFAAFLDLPDGAYAVTVKRHRKQRSNPQNDYLWGVVYPAVLRGFIDMGWDELTDTDQIHELCKAKFLTTEAVNKHTGEIVSFPLSTARMDTLQFSTYVDRIADFAREHLNTIIPAPKR